MQVDSLGQIVDLRDKSTCPSLKNISQWPSAKIKEHCIIAYTKQMEQLAEAEGTEGRLMRKLKSELHKV